MSARRSGLVIHNVEMQPGRGGQIARAAGSFVRLMAPMAITLFLLPSGELRRIHAECRATIGEAGNSEFTLRSYGKAGRRRWLGRRPHVAVTLRTHRSPTGGSRS